MTTKMEIWLARLTANDPTLKALGIVNTILSLDECKKLGKAIEVNTTLRELSIVANIGVYGCIVIGMALRRSTTLQKLRINDDDISGKGCVALANVLEDNTTLELLNLNNTTIFPDGCMALAKALERNTALQGFSLRDNKIGDDGCGALGKALEGNTTLQDLNLGWNGIRDDGCAALAKALEGNTALQTLCLTGNNISVDGCTALSNALEGNTALQELYLGNNEIGDDGRAVLAKVFAKVLKTNTALRTFRVGDKKNITIVQLGVIDQLLHDNKVAAMTSAAVLLGSSHLPYVRRKLEELPHDNRDGVLQLEEIEAWRSNPLATSDVGALVLSYLDENFDFTF